MNKTKIEWCDYTWNPIVGCSPVSEGCENCYAAAISKRFKLPWGTAHFLPERLDQVLGMKKLGRVFVGSMTDLGHESVKYEWIKAVATMVSATPWRTYIVLTKRPGAWLRMLPPACWVGVSIETQAQIVRWRALSFWAQPRAVQFVSVEPMLGPVSIQCGHSIAPDWVIAGPETGAKARPCQDEWIEKLAAESPCFFDKRKKAGVRREWPGDAGNHQVVAGERVKGNGGVKP